MEPELGGTGTEPAQPGPWPSLVTVEQFSKPQGYRVDFLKVLVTTWKTQNFTVTTWNFP